MQRRQFLRTAGATAGAVAAAGPAATQEDGNQTAGNQTEGGAGGATETVAVGPDANLVFEPADLTVAPGTTVVWEWDSNTHNVVVESKPDESDWEGQPASETFDTGYVYEHTFEVEGTYDYYCQPHRAQGMEGSVEVTADAAGGGGGGPPTVPASAMNLAIGVMAAMATVLSLAFFFLKYGGRPTEE